MLKLVIAIAAVSQLAEAGARHCRCVSVEIVPSSNSFTELSDTIR